MACVQHSLPEPTATTLSLVWIFADDACNGRQVLSSGQCGCRGYDLTQGDDYESIYYNMVDLDELIGDFDADVKRQVVAALCTTPMNDGDHLQVRFYLFPVRAALDCAGFELFLRQRSTVLVVTRARAGAFSFPISLLGSASVPSDVWPYFIVRP